MNKVKVLEKYMSGCQNYGPFLGALNIRCRIVIGTSKGTKILTATHMTIGYLDPQVVSRGIERTLVNKFRIAQH